MSTPEDTAKALLATITKTINGKTTETATLLALVKILLQKIHTQQPSSVAASATPSAVDLAALHAELAAIKLELQKTEKACFLRGGTGTGSAAHLHGDDDGGIYLDRAFLERFTKLISIYYSYK